jgi:hypothetical protein
MNKQKAGVQARLNTTKLQAANQDELTKAPKRFGAV